MRAHSSSHIFVCLLFFLAVGLQSICLGWTHTETLFCKINVHQSHHIENSIQFSATKPAIINLMRDDTMAWYGRRVQCQMKVKPFYVKYTYEMIQSEIIWLKRRFVCKMTIPHTHTVWHKSTSELLKWIKAQTHTLIAHTNDVNRYTYTIHKWGR